MKQCAKCKKILPIAEFHKDKSRQDGVYSYCKKCNYENVRKYIEKKPKHYSEYGKRYRVKNHEKLMDYSRKWAINNRTRHIQTSCDWQHRNKDRVFANNIKRNFGISVKQYSELLKNQGGVCAICGSIPNAKKRMAIDHDHKTGRIRGLLCHMCNLSLGGFRDDPEMLKAAIVYLDIHAAGEHEAQIREALNA